MRTWLRTIRAAVQGSGGWGPLARKVKDRLSADGINGFINRLKYHVRAHSVVNRMRADLANDSRMVSPAIFISPNIPLESLRQCRFGVMAHIYYPDLFPEVCSYLRNIPVPFDLMISITRKEHRPTIFAELDKIKNTRKTIVKLVPNRGRNVAPLLVAFKEEIAALDFVCHIHTKKSLYTGSERKDWRSYLYHELLGSEDRVMAIFAQLVTDPNVGMVYPETYDGAPYWAHTWLSNRLDGMRLMHALGFESVDFSQYIDYPLGSMFWARSVALKPLLDLDLTYDDFPEECGQTDGTLHHAIERCFVFSSLAANMTQRVIRESSKHEFFAHNHKNLHQYLAFPIRERVRNSASNAKTVSFDIFDTLLIRPFADPDSVLRKLEQEVSARFGIEDFYAKRKEAESRTRQRKSEGDVAITEIYTELAEHEGLDLGVAEKLKTMEIAAERRFLVPRQRVVEVARELKSQGARIISVSDMYLERPHLEQILNEKGIDFVDAIYVSNDIGSRKDQGRIWDTVLEREGTTKDRLLHVGDNEQSDIQKLVDNAFLPPVHVMRPAALMGQLTSAENLFRLFHHHYTWRNDLITGVIANELARRADRDETELDLSFAQPRLLGFSIYGPIIFSFLAKLIYKAREDGIEHFKFLSREGWLLEKAYCAIRNHPALDETREQLPSGGYLLCARTFVGLASIDDDGTGLELLLKAHYKGTLRHILSHRFGLEEQSLSGYLNDSELDRVLALPDDRQHILDQLMKCLPLIRQRARTDRSLFLKYWRETVGTIDTDKVGLVDIGFSGTIQKALSRILERPLSGYYFVTNQSAREIPDAGGRCWGCYGEFVALGDEPPIHRYGLIMEAVLTSPHGQLRGFRETEHGIEPLYREPGEAQHHFEVLDEIHQGSIEFVAQMVGVLGEEAFSPYWDTDTVQKLVELVAHRYIDIGELSRLLSVEDEFSGNATLSVLDFYAEREGITTPR